MTRLTSLRNDQLDDRGKTLWDAIAGTRGSSVIDPQGGLAGPFNAWLHAPEVGTAMSKLGSILRFEMSIDRRLIELAIITVGARWQAEFEWFAHAAMAKEHGVTEGVIDAIGEDRIPDFELDDERAVYAVAHQLVRTGRLDDDVYGPAAALLGEQGTVELVTLCGYYTLISFTLNAFEVPLPAGVSQRWPEH